MAVSVTASRARGFIWGGVVVHVRLFAVPLLFLVAWVVMAVDDRAVVVLVCMPVGAMLPLVQRLVRVVMGDVVVIVAVHTRRMGVLRLITLAFGALDDLAARLPLHIAIDGCTSCAASAARSSSAANWTPGACAGPHMQLSN
jgi:hypothetical protein